MAEPGAGAPAAGGGEGGAAAAPAPGATSLLDPANDTPQGGTGGSDSNAAAKAAADAAAAAAASGKGDASSKTGDKKDGAASGAPEKYETFKVPDGISLNPDVVTEFSTVAKELGLSQEAAQKLVDLNARIALKAVEQGKKDLEEAKVALAAETRKELGPKYDAERILAAKGRDKFASPELVKILNESGYGNHPEVFKLFAKLGKAIAEDGFVEGRAAGSGDAPLKSTSEVLFGGTTPSKK